MIKNDIYTIQPGNPEILGVTKLKNKTYNFAAVIPDGQEAFLLLYHGSEEPYEIPLPKEQRTGSVSAVLVTGLADGKFQYNYKINGTVVQDPYACSLYGREVFGVLDEEAGVHAVRCGIPDRKRYNWKGDRNPDLPYHEMILYKLHVRGYTKQAPIRKKGTFAGLREMIPYLKKLGINAVECMPVYEFSEIPTHKELIGFVSSLEEKDKVNFWGYTESYYFAPKRAYCWTDDPEKEMKDLIRAFHQEGIACILEFFFPKEINPLLTLRVLHHWRKEYHIDGFHLIGDGVPVRLLTADPILSSTKLMFQSIDGAIVSKKQKAEDENLAEYNQSFQQTMRCFLKSDAYILAGAAYQIKNNPDPCGVIKYMASQDGFTLYDTVSYNDKHNEDNGQNNRDGSECNCSWNCGIEGDTKKKQILSMRMQQMKNAFLMMLLSSGTPMLYQGDEIANSQGGNNNAWCQDNPIGWINWKNTRKYKGLQEFLREAIAFRKEHPILHTPEQLKGTDYLALGYPDISFHSQKAWYAGYEENRRCLGVMYAGKYVGQEEFLYVGYNFYWEEKELALPNLAGRFKWMKAADTSEKESFFVNGQPLESQKMISLKPRSIVILIGKMGEEEKDAEKDAAISSVETL